MAGSVNKVDSGRQSGQGPGGAPAEFRRSGRELFASPRPRPGATRPRGERKERTEWHNIVIFNENLGKVAEQYCKKGTKVYVEGQLQTRKWQDQNGQRPLHDRDRAARASAAN